jgi:hypothetical protein
MALSYVTYPSDGVTVQYDIPFGYLRKQHVFAFVNDELRGFKWISNSRIELLVAPQPDDAVRFQRLTERATRVTNFTDGQTLLAGDLNAGDLQNFYVMQELIDQIADGLLLGDLTILNPDGGWITAAWIAEQIDSSAPPAALEGLAALIAQEELFRAAAVTAEANERTAALVAEALARVDADTALADSLSAVLTRTADAEAAIIANATTSADGISALATDLSAVTARTAATEASVIGLDTAIANEQSARAEAIAITNAAVGANAANITTVEEALVTEALTRASSVDALNARVDNSVFSSLYGWDLVSDDGGWTSIAGGTQTKTSEGITVVTDGTNGWRLVPPNALSIPGSKLTALRIRMRRRDAPQPSNWLGRFEYQSEIGSYGTGGNTVIDTDLPREYAQDEWFVWTVYLDATFRARSNVTFVRFRIADGFGIAATYEISHIAFGTAGFGASSAQITTVANAQVTDNAARASEISLLEAKSNRTNTERLIVNPFVDNPGGGTPTGWTNWVYNGVHQPVDAPAFPGWGKCMYITVTAGVVYNGFYQIPQNIVGGRQYTTRCVFRRGSGSIDGMLFYIEWRTSAGAYISVEPVMFKQEKDIDGNLVGIYPNGWKTVEKTVVAPATAAQCIFYFMTNFSAYGDVSEARSVYLAEANLLEPSQLAAGVQQTKVALTDSTGAYAYYGLKINAGDNSVASIEAMSDTKTALSKLKLKADKIEMEGAVVINGTLYKEKIAPNQATKLSNAYTAAALGLSGGGWSTVQSLSVSTSGGPLLVIASAFCVVGTDTSQSSQQARILRDGAVIYGPGVFNETFGGDARSPLTVTLSDTPAAGTRAYLFQVFTTARTDLNLLQASHRSLAIMESIR